MLRKFTYSVVVFSILFLSIRCADVQGADNLIKNPSFETDANRDGVPDGWTHGAGHHGRWQQKLKKQLARRYNRRRQSGDGVAPACLLALASRGYADFLIDRLAKLDFAKTETNDLHLQSLKSISTSQEKPVQDEMLEIIKTTRNDDYFIAALAGVEKPNDPSVLKHAQRILNSLPKKTDDGREILRMIGQQFPGRAKTIYKQFLATGRAHRAETMCRVLWYGSPHSKEILGPLLDDRRKLDGFSSPMQVCDRAAQAISHTTDKIKFDNDWGRKQKDLAILKLKEYCASPGNYPRSFSFDLGGRFLYCVQSASRQRDRV